MSTPPYSSGYIPHQTKWDPGQNRSSTKSSPTHIEDIRFAPLTRATCSDGWFFYDWILYEIEHPAVAQAELMREAFTAYNKAIGQPLLVISRHLVNAVKAAGVKLEDLQPLAIVDEYLEDDSEKKPNVAICPPHGEELPCSTCQRQNNLKPQGRASRGRGKWSSKLAAYRMRRIR